MNRRSLPIVLASLLILVACEAATSPTPSPSASADVPSGSEEPGGTPVASIDPAPTEDLDPFSCELPVVKPATEPPNINIVDVRVGTHEGFDRVVVEFDSGTPEFTVDRAEPPFFQDGTGAPMEVEGEAFLVLVMRGGTAMTDEGGSSYDGPHDFDPALPRLVDLIQGGDFEAQSTWYLGLTGEACTRVFTLSEPDRLVIDVEH
jgi:hypothetical protein